MTKLSRDFIFVTFFIFIIGIIIAANRGSLGNSFSFASQIPYFDKIGHFILMGLLAFFAIISLVPRMRGPQQKATLKIVAILLVMIALEEISQHFIPSRTFSIADYLCGFIGVLVASFVSKWLPLQQKSR